MRVKQEAQQRQTVKVVIGELPKKRRRRARRSKPKEKEPTQTRIVTQYLQQFPPAPNSTQTLPQTAQPNQPIRPFPERQPNDPIDLVDRKNYVLEKLAEQFSRSSGSSTPYVPSPIEIPEVPTPDFGIPRPSYPKPLPSQPGRFDRERQPEDSIPLGGMNAPPIFNQASSSGQDEKRRLYERYTKKLLIEKLKDIGMKGIKNKNKEQLVELAVNYLP